MSVSLLTGVAAKEIVVSTIAVLYHADSDENQTELANKLKNEKYMNGPRKGQQVFTPLSAISFILFILIYFPCIAVVAAVKKESGSWKWAAFMVIYTTAIAWLVSFVVYQTGSILF